MIDHTPAHDPVPEAVPAPVPRPMPEALPDGPYAEDYARVIPAPPRHAAPPIAPPMPPVGPPVDEPRVWDLEAVMGSLTGWDQVAIEKQFGRPLSKLGELAIYAAAFTLHRRDGMSAGPAYKEAMDSTLDDLNAMFGIDADADADAGGGPDAEGAEFRS